MSRKWPSFVALAATLLFTFTAHGAPPPSGFVGVTTATAAGGDGIVDFNQMCAVEFPGSRFCSTEEIWKTIDPPSVPAAGAWVRPVIVPLLGTSRLTSFSNLGFDVMGFATQGIEDLTCLGWSFTVDPFEGASALFGLSVGPGGRFGVGACSVSRAVACCTPPK